MAAKLSFGAKKNFLKNFFQREDVLQIEAEAKSQDVAELMAKEGFALRSKNFITDTLIDIATQATLVDVVYQVIHDTAKLLDAGLTRPQIAELAINAASKAEVQDMLKAAQDAKEARKQLESGEEIEGAQIASRDANEALQRLLNQLCPQTAPAQPAGAKHKPATVEVTT